MDQISEQRLSLVHPELSKRIYQLDSLLIAGDPSVHIRVVQGLRTYAEQNALYAQGRTVSGKIVTNAKGGDSAHNFGYAADCVPDDPQFPAWTPDWNASDIRWKELLGKALTCGLLEGAQWRTFPDMPHLYLAELPADPDDTMKYVFTEGGLEAVFRYFDGIVKLS